MKRALPRYSKLLFLAIKTEVLAFLRYWFNVDTGTTTYSVTLFPRTTLVVLCSHWFSWTVIYKCEYKVSWDGKQTSKWNVALHSSWNLAVNCSWKGDSKSGKCMRITISSSTIRGTKRQFDFVESRESDANTKTILLLDLCQHKASIADQAVSMRRWHCTANTRMPTRRAQVNSSSKKK